MALEWSAILWYDLEAWLQVTVSPFVFIIADGGLLSSREKRNPGTAQANISRFESGNYNPSLAFLQKMAESLGKTLRISLE